MTDTASINLPQFYRNVLDDPTEHSSIKEAILDYAERLARGEVFFCTTSDPRWIADERYSNEIQVKVYLYSPAVAWALLEDSNRFTGISSFIASTLRPPVSEAMYEYEADALFNKALGNIPQPLEVYCVANLADVRGTSEYCELSALRASILGAAV